MTTGNFLPYVFSRNLQKFRASFAIFSFMQEFVEMLRKHYREHGMGQCLTNFSRTALRYEHLLTNFRLIPILQNIQQLWLNVELRTHLLLSYFTISRGKAPVHQASRRDKITKMSKINSRFGRTKTHTTHRTSYLFCVCDIPRGRGGTVKLIAPRPPRSMG